MKLPRRGFLQALGLGALFGGVAVKAVADQGEPFDGRGDLLLGPDGDCHLHTFDQDTDRCVRCNVRQCDVPVAGVSPEVRRIWEQATGGVCDGEIHDWKGRLNHAGFRCRVCDTTITYADWVEENRARRPDDLSAHIEAHKRTFSANSAPPLRPSRSVFELYRSRRRKE